MLYMEKHNYKLYEVWKKGDFDLFMETINELYTLKKVGSLDWIDEWLELFPKGMKTNGKLVRSDRKGCETKMQSFLKDYKYDKDFIIKVTKEYIEDKLENGGYLRCAIYFIGKKGEGSDLAAACENFEEKAPDKYKFTNSNDFI